MKIQNFNAHYIPQESGLEGIYKQIEQAGRTCYKSEDKITKDSAKAFVDRMIKSGHLSMLEHGTVYLRIPHGLLTTEGFSALDKYNTNKYSICKEVVDFSNDTYLIGLGSLCITTNMRVLVENGWEDDLKYLCEPTEHHVKRYTVKLTTNIGVTREGNRHRQSIAEESTRYCNYSHDKFDNNVQYVKPVWISDTDIDFVPKVENLGILQELIGDIVSDYKHDDICYCNTPVNIYATAIKFAEMCYHLLIKLGWTPQQAREVLPLATKSDVVYTKFEDEWEHFFNLRLYGTTGRPHPNMEVCAKLIYSVFMANNIKFSSHGNLM